MWMFLSWIRSVASDNGWPCTWLLRSWFFLICNAVILFQGEYHINHTPESKKCWKGVGLSIIFKNKRNGTTSVCRLSYTQRQMIKYGQITQTVKITTTQKSAISIKTKKAPCQYYQWDVKNLHINKNKTKIDLIFLNKNMKYL